MPLNEREQRILEEIERQFYEEDPKLAQAVANTSLESVQRRWNRLAYVGFVVGLFVMLASFTQWTVVALIGFLIMVVSAGWIAMNLRRRTHSTAAPNALGSWVDQLRQRWQRDR